VWLHDTTVSWLLTTKLPECIISPMKSAKAMTIRLTEEQAEELETVANVENRPVSEIIRAAIAEHVQRVSRTPDFQSSLRERISKAERLLKD
jgi:predicted transcriptional regulator